MIICALVKYELMHIGASVLQNVTKHYFVALLLW